MLRSTLQNIVHIRIEINVLHVLITELHDLRALLDGNIVNKYGVTLQNVFAQLIHAVITGLLYLILQLVLEYAARNLRKALPG